MVFTVVHHPMRFHRTSQIHQGLQWQDAAHQERMLHRQLAAVNTRHFTNLFQQIFIADNTHVIHPCLTASNSGQPGYAVLECQTKLDFNAAKMEVVMVLIRTTPCFIKKQPSI